MASVAVRLIAQHYRYAEKMGEAPPVLVVRDEDVDELAEELRGPMFEPRVLTGEMTQNIASMIRSGDMNFMGAQLVVLRKHAGMRPQTVV